MLPKFDFQNQVNAVGGLALLLVGSYLVWDATRSREIAICSARYPVATQMSLQKPNGAALSPAEFQARVGFGERGVIENTVVRSTDGPMPLVLDFKLGGPVTADTGAAFPWSLPGVTKAKSACLSYSVFVPNDFDFGAGGTLPGLFGTTAAGGNGRLQTGFNTRIAWNDEAGVGVLTNLSSSTNDVEGGELGRYLSGFKMPRGRWVRIEQEAVLNSPNAKDGLLRVWIDGRLSVEDPAIAWRGTGNVQLGGALIDIGYVHIANRTEKKPTKLSISPLQLSWQ